MINADQNVYIEIGPPVGNEDTPAWHRVTHGAFMIRVSLTFRPLHPHSLPSTVAHVFLSIKATRTVKPLGIFGSGSARIDRTLKPSP